MKNGDLKNGRISEAENILDLLRKILILKTVNGHLE